MPRGRTEKIHEVKRRIARRIGEGFYRAGDRFMSARLVAERFAISYQTAHRLLGELCKDGLLVRRGQSGTYIPGASGPLEGVLLVFNRRAKKPESFGDKLLHLLTGELQTRGIGFKVRWADEKGDAKPDDRRLTVIWEAKGTLARCAAERRPAVLLNDRPEPGMGSLFTDSVSTDDYGGGVCAAELMRSGSGRGRGAYAILAGPADDPRSKLRAEGFRSHLRATVFTAGGWFFDHGYKAAARAVKGGPNGVFCCNDQLAAAVLKWCEGQGVAPPPVIGFDDAPVAEKLNLTTISIPWEEMVRAAGEVIERRIGGDRGASCRLVFHPRPVVRGVGTVAG